MNTTPTLLALLSVVIFTAPVGAVKFANSPTLDLLRREALTDPAFKYTSESAKSSAGDSFSGKTVVNGSLGLPVSTEDASWAAGEGKDGPQAKKRRVSYHFKSKSPLPGVNLYTPVKDETGDEVTDEPKEAKDPLKWIKYGTLGVGALLTIAGIFFPPLLFLGGLALGIGAALWFLTGKKKKKKD